MRVAVLAIEEKVHGHAKSGVCNSSLTRITLVNADTA
jgi:hypothetical protein